MNIEQNKLDLALLKVEILQDPAAIRVLQYFLKRTRIYGRVGSDIRNKQWKLNKLLRCGFIKMGVISGKNHYYVDLEEIAKVPQAIRNNLFDTKKQ